ncbi:MAG: hypothetical protein HZT40_17995 [Candidatus Thiothrix singaporensis]|uniref:Uncharacterized protein n=1 Tax=Candidatus Thiothrix singaporensis TaxID=2799669 RepID=A0A7L6AVL5_9GAMM|nr:MAG: hypothetical protein HZT40_17995 [Candidatus Thiothrix singaporensis]
MDKILFLNNQVKFKTMIKTIIANTGKALAVIALLLGILIVWSTHVENTAHTKALDFCETITIKQKTDGLLEQAWLAGADRRQTNWMTAEAGKPDSLFATFTGVSALSRHICVIEATNGSVTSKHLQYLD